MFRSLATLAFVTVLAPGLRAQDTLQFPLRQNLIKIGLTSGFASTVSINYERVLNDEWSVAMTASYMLPRRPDGLVDLETEHIDLSSNREMTGWFITPEVKWYLEKNDVRPAPRGFYVGGYARVSNLRLTSELHGTAASTETNGSIDGNLKVNLLEYGLGIDAGYQLLMAHDRLALDFVFFGPRYSLYTLKVEADLAGEGDLAEDLESALEDALGRDILPLNVDVSAKGSTSTTSNSLGYRFGFKLGYAF